MGLTLSAVYDILGDWFRIRAHNSATGQQCETRVDAHSVKSGGVSAVIPAAQSVAHAVGSQATPGQIASLAQQVYTLNVPAGTHTITVGGGGACATTTGGNSGVGSSGGAGRVVFATTAPYGYYPYERDVWEIALPYRRRPQGVALVHFTGDPLPTPIWFYDRTKPFEGAESLVAEKGKGFLPGKVYEFPEVK